MTLAEYSMTAFALANGGRVIAYVPQIMRVCRDPNGAAAVSVTTWIFFTAANVATVVYALIDQTSNYDALSHDLQPWMTIHGSIMVLAGLGFGLAVIRAALLPRWTAVALMVGVILVALSQNLPEGPQLLAAGIRDLGFAGMGAALLLPSAASGRNRLVLD